MLFNKREKTILIEFKNGGIKQLQTDNDDLYHLIFEEYDRRKIKRLKTVIKDRRNNIVGYHIFYDSLSHEKFESGEATVMLYKDVEKTGYIGYTIGGLPYYTFAKLGERRGVKIDVSLIQKYLK